MLYYIETRPESALLVHGTPEHFTVEIEIPEPMMREYLLAQTAYENAREMIAPFVKGGKKLGAIPRRRFTNSALTEIGV